MISRRFPSIPAMCARLGKKIAVVALFGVLALHLSTVHATDNYEYGATEYVTISKGLSPDGKLAITTHGEGEYGNGGFHVFLTDALTGRKIGPLEEIKDFLDTGAGAFGAMWSRDSRSVVIIHRVDRHELEAISYRFDKGRAFLIKGPVKATEAQTAFWSKECSGEHPSPKTFGTPKAG